MGKLGRCAGVSKERPTHNRLAVEGDARCSLFQGVISPGKADEGLAAGGHVPLTREVGRELWTSWIATPDFQQHILSCHRVVPGSSLIESALWYPPVLTHVFLSSFLSRGGHELSLPRGRNLCRETKSSMCGTARQLAAAPANCFVSLVIDGSSLAARCRRRERMAAPGVASWRYSQLWSRDLQPIEGLILFISVHTRIGRKAVQCWDTEIGCAQPARSVYLIEYHKNWTNDEDDIRNRVAVARKKFVRHSDDVIQAKYSEYPSTKIGATFRCACCFCLCVDEPGSKPCEERGAVAERLVSSPPTKSNRVESSAGNRIFASGNRAGRCRWSTGFLGDLPFPPILHSGTAPYSLQPPSSAQKTSLLRAVQISSLMLLNRAQIALVGGWDTSRAITAALCTHPIISSYLLVEMRDIRLIFTAVRQLAIIKEANSQDLESWEEVKVFGNLLDCSPPTKANRVQSSAGSHRNFRKWKSCRTLAAGGRVFSGISRFHHTCIPALLHSHLFSTLIGSQGLVKSRANPSTLNNIAYSSLSVTCRRNNIGHQTFKRRGAIGFIGGRMLPRLFLPDYATSPPPSAQTTSHHATADGGCAVSKPLDSHQGDPGSIPDGFTPGFSHAGIVLDDAACRKKSLPMPAYTSTGALSDMRPLARPPATPGKANRAQSSAGSPDFRNWESGRTMPLVCGFSWGSSVSPAPYFRRRVTFNSPISPSAALKTSLLRATRIWANSPGVISENQGKPKSGWSERESNPGPPECESSALPLRHIF
ncbi:hypothetical protein PR048_004996 [Dryococelus australis]|uniref:Uncharacterized protein n=1 Tax=Dryococelus australis TaxID=614101 RepID=A0ABQ9I7U9_9NEOP|nr:hypothetical protein PR048_004996 [Dryococelus australis]